ncbi:Aste57867_1660 [Aphanomyces stellatus]|uniref:Aste57867_1660 protein n=1 Tax=Aphanomyces stellatus TaxID=120398 RepID=A0A485K990_9STRA|nr:hypothetical protein As57867_001658 [Aphanomyces stellatus]VFT78872.1 Aste57867_1660 [Aphanomyces stellatus]
MGAQGEGENGERPWTGMCTPPSKRDGESVSLEFKESGSGDVRQRVPRIIDRSTTSPNHSLGAWNIRRMRSAHAWRMYLSAPFHTLVNMSLYKVLLCLTTVYLILIVVFALLYLLVDPSCKMAIETFPQSFIFSVSTLFTIGFGAGGNDIFFNSCGSAIFLITAQTIIGVFVSAVAFGIFYARFARGQSRAATVSVSAYACVQKIRGALYFSFQTCEMRKHQVAGRSAHSMLRDPSQVAPLPPPSAPHAVVPDASPAARRRPERVVDPGLADHLRPSTRCVESVDAARRGTAQCAQRRCRLHVSRHEHIALVPSSCHSPLPPIEPPQRVVDVDTGTREDRYRTQKEPLFDRTVDPATSLLTSDEMDSLLRYWDETQMEVIVLVEGIDAATSATTQVRHSYKPCDVLFNQQFVNCVFVEPETGAAIIDFNLFDATAPLDLDTVQIKDD